MSRSKPTNPDKANSQPAEQNPDIGSSAASLYDWSPTRVAEVAEMLGLMLQASSAGCREVVFINTGIPGWEQLREAVRPDALTILMSPSNSGIAFVTSVLERYTDVDSIHILSPGGHDFVQMGSVRLSLQTLDQFQAQLSQWGKSLTKQADITLFGCNVTAKTGREFLTRLGKMTGADIIAYSDLTDECALCQGWGEPLQPYSVDTSSVD